MKRMLWGFLVVCFVVSPVMAAPVITIENTTLAPNTPNQAVLIHVSGIAASTVNADDIFLEVGSGSSGPWITDLDALTGTVFQGRSGASVPGGYPMDPITSVALSVLVTRS